MLRLHHRNTLNIDDEIELTKESSHHLVQVMRARIGEKFIIFNASGEFIARIENISKKSVRARVELKHDCNTESPCQITLIQAITRRERMDYSIQKATELGVACIQPVLTEHCVVKLDAKKARQRLVHWQGIAQHASEQSGRLIIPEIKPVLAWGEAVALASANKKSLKLIFALLAAQPLASIKDTEALNIIFALGPVGGFSDSEVQLALAQGFNAIKLGPRILRAETATAAALTALQMRWGDLD